MGIPITRQTRHTARAYPQGPLVLFEGDVASAFLKAILAHDEVRPLLSDEHFYVDGTLIDAWASMKSSRAVDDSDEGDGPDDSNGRNGEHDFHGAKRSNAIH